MTFGIYLMLNVVLLLFLAIWLRRLIVRRLEPERILTDLNNEIGELITELNQTGDHNVSVLEDRIMQLRDVVADADRQIDELSTLVQHVQSEQASTEPVYTVSFSGSSTGQEDSPAGEVNHHPSNADANTNLDAVSVPEPRPPASRTQSAEPVTAPAEILSPREHVRELHQQGLSSELIAGKTGMAIGEVELIISLGTRRGER